MTSEETRRERYHQSSDGVDEMQQQRDQKKPKSRKKNVGTLFNENHATSTAKPSLVMLAAAWLSITVAQILS